MTGKGGEVRAGRVHVAEHGQMLIHAQSGFCYEFPEVKVAIAGDSNLTGMFSTHCLATLPYHAPS